MTVTLSHLVITWRAVRSTRARLEKRAHLRRLFESLDPAELRLAASYLSGEIPQGRVQVGWRALTDALRAAERGGDMPLFAAFEGGTSGAGAAPTLTELDACLSTLRELHGPGSSRRRVGVLRDLLQPLDEEQRRFVRGLFLGELRQGALRAVVIDALAETFDVDVEALRRAVMFAGTLGEVIGGLHETSDVTQPWRRTEVLASFGPRHGVPVEPMLAATADDMRAGLEGLGARVAVEWKLDGVRVQVHRKGGDVRVFSRRLRDVTGLVPETVAFAHALDAESFILDGEVIGFDGEGRPVPFQDLMSRFSRQRKGGTPASATADSSAGAGSAAIERVSTWFFDVLELDGRSWVDEPYEARRAALEECVDAAHRVPQGRTDDIEAATRIFDEARQAGHEGVVLKQLDAPYTAGRRGSAWRKLKPAETLDLVILAAEWGHGRRKGFLSNLHLGARDADDSERFHMLGKTFKGLTDAMLEEMTSDLLAIATERGPSVVRVRPEQVVEIAFDTVQRSRRYDSGFALRFARVERFRPDKSPQQADTLDDVQRIFTAKHVARPSAPPAAGSDPA